MCNVYPTLNPNERITGHIFLFSLSQNIFILIGLQLEMYWAMGPMSCHSIGFTITCLFVTLSLYMISYDLQHKGNRGMRHRWTQCWPTALLFIVIKLGMMCSVCIQEPTVHMCYCTLYVLHYSYSEFEYRRDDVQKFINRIINTQR